MRVLLRLLPAPALTGALSLNDSSWSAFLLSCHFLPPVDDLLLNVVFRISSEDSFMLPGSFISLFHELDVLPALLPR